ncbi:hypothetical protein VPH35_113912 [Triticum aestivum]|uniref:Uncharacterized protein n=1 Tax=Triticum turgidum subsp. durum TaxID=4567 RepID=A0A9R0YZ29_TRITD|nr:unnamed protein product [Triticum turgidum subsp. durum]
MCLSVRDHWCGAETRDAHCEERGMHWKPSLGADFKHENLARLTIYGFQSAYRFIRYVKRVISVAVNIKEISLHDTKVCDFCTEEFGLKRDDCLSKYTRTSRKKDLLRERIKEGLVMTSPAAIHFN